MFNIGGGELIVILVIALIVLGPDKLPDAIRKAGRFYGEVRRMSSGFQAELRDAIDEPMREIRSTTDLVKSTFTDAELDIADDDGHDHEPSQDGDQALDDAAVNGAVDGDRPEGLARPAGSPVDAGLPAPVAGALPPPPAPTATADPSLPPPPPAAAGTAPPPPPPA